MAFLNNDFDLFKKKTKKAENFINLEAVKIAGFLTSTAIAISNALKEKVYQQDIIAKKKKKEAEAAKAQVIAGFIGGALLGAAGAILLTPESGNQLRSRISHYFDDTVNQDNIKKMAKTAKKKAAKFETKVNGSH